MSDKDQLGFTRFVPGFDFLQNLAKGTAMPQLPSMSNWVAPTLNVEEVDKRIGELKAVHFWLEQNSKMLGATIQALEVQKMTLATLKGMNFNMAEMANALKLKPSAPVPAPVADPPEKAAEPAAEPEPPAEETKKRSKSAKGQGTAPASVIDPMQWWGALSQQFQQIATDAMKDAARNSAMDAAKTMAAGVARGAANTAAGMVRAATTGAGKPRAPARKAARKSAARKVAAKAR